MNKQIELQLKKKIFIIEAKIGDIVWDVPTDEKGNHPLEFICKGSELTEEIVKGLVEEMNHVPKDYKTGKWKPTPLLSFISAIEAQGYYWGENPIKIDKYPKYAMEMSTLINTWRKSESKTFNPEKTLIFEIL